MSKKGQKFDNRLEMKVAIVVRRMMEAAGLTQTELGEKVGRTQAAISRTFKHGIPFLRLLQALASAMGSTAGGILKEAEDLSDSEIESAVAESQRGHTRPVEQWW